MLAHFRRFIPALIVLAAACKSGDGPPSGALTITVTGLPSGPAAIMVTGPKSYSKAVTATTTLSNLPAGTYTVTASNVVIGTATYTPAPTTTGVSITTTTLNAAIDYTLSTGGLALTVSGLPGGVNANVLVTGPGGFSQTATASHTFTGLTPGSYVITANVVTSGSTTYGGTPPTQTVVVPASLTNATAAEAYSVMTGSITVTISGLPGGLNPNVLVTGPFAYSHAITASGATVLSALPLGTYTIGANNVSNATATYAPGAATQTVTLASGALAGSKSVVYTIITGSLTVTVSGLPGGVNAAIMVTGPSSYSQSVTATTTLNKLVPGTYTIAASNVTSGPTTYVPAPTSQTKAIVASVTPGAAAVAYTSVAGLNLTIDGLYVTQSTQSYNDTVPLVANRAGYLRVFVKANQANTVTPKVRVRWYSGASLIRTDTINSPRPNVPTTESEDSLVGSWNLPVPAALVQPNLKIIADVDPANLIPETNEADNTFPSSGMLAFNVKTVPIFHEVLIPVKTSHDGLTGNVTAANESTYTAFVQQVHPISTYTVKVHALFTIADTSVVLKSDGTGWGNVLFAVSALHGMEDTTPLIDSSHYYGVVKTSYGSGVIGLGFEPGMEAIGWDASQVDQTLAHETGHNWSLAHAPGCGSDGTSPPYPVATGKLDAYGFDSKAVKIYSPASYYDLMSYCRPYWISNYHYIQVLNFRFSEPEISPPAEASGPERVLLVWGHVVNGRIVLEPAFEIDAMAKLPEGHGAFTLEALDEGGAPMYARAFEGSRVADDPQNSSGFMFKIPLRELNTARLSALRVRGQGMEALVGNTPAVAAMRTGSAPASGLLARLRGDASRVTWDHATYPMAIVRDARTGEVLAFARHGVVDVPAKDLVVVLSNGVRSVTQRITAQ